MITDAVVWLCRSPRRLAVGAVVLLTVVLLGGSLLFDGGSDGDLARPAATATAAVPAQVPDADPFVVAAVTFTEHWAKLRDGQSAEQWQEALVPLTTPDLAAALRTTDPANLPGVGPEGEPVVRVVGTDSSMIAVPLADRSSVLVSVVRSGGKLLVSDVQPNVGD